MSISDQISEFFGFNKKSHDFVRKPIKKTEQKRNIGSRINSTDDGGFIPGNSYYQTYGVDSPYTAPIEPYSQSSHSNIHDNSHSSHSCDTSSSNSDTSSGSSDSGSSSCDSGGGSDGGGGGGD